MKLVKIAELKDRLSHYLRAAERGSEVVVTDRDRPIARILPVITQRAALTVLPPKVSFASVRRKTWRSANWAIQSAELLAEERSER
jgi:prevent-host-death family protein